MVEIWMTKLCF